MEYIDQFTFKKAPDEYRDVFRAWKGLPVNLRRGKGVGNRSPGAPRRALDERFLIPFPHLSRILNIFDSVYHLCWLANIPNQGQPIDDLANASSQALTLKSFS
jgi:hypothetical protein